MMGATFFDFDQSPRPEHAEGAGHSQFSTSRVLISGKISDYDASDYDALPTHLL
jgi:hypothetical protein